MRLLPALGPLLLVAPATLAADPAPVVAPGPLVIVGGGTTPAAARHAVFDLAGGHKAKLVVIPTAGDKADDPAAADGLLKGWRALKPASVVVLHTRDRARADDPAFVKPLLDATGVWFDGGSQSKITAAYKGTLVEKELMKLHRRGGVISGSSAGAAVMSDPMVAGGSGDGVKTAPGHGYLPGVIVDMHYTERKRDGRLAAVLGRHRGSAGLGIDEGTAVIVRGAKAKVVGAGTVTARLPAGGGKAASAEVTKAGGTIDLDGLRKAAAGRAGVAAGK